MPRKTYKCICEVTVHAVRSPGCWLPNRDDTYVTVQVFNITKRTRLVDAIFPLIFHETFTFEKTFWSAQDAYDVVDMMEDVKVAFELRQVADVYLGGTLMAYFDSTGRDFFYPWPSTVPRLEKDRELIMERTIDFPGISPRVEFSTYTVIQETSTPYLDAIEDAYLSKPVRNTRSYIHEPDPPSRATTPHYERPTVTSILRSRSPSPRRLAKETLTSDLATHRSRSRSAMEFRTTEPRPNPPIVRPSRSPIRRPATASGVHRGLWSQYYASQKRRQQAPFGPARSRSASPMRGFSRPSEDAEVARIMRRYRSPSPIYKGPSDNLRHRVDEVLERSRRTLERYGSPPFYRRDSLEALEQELLMAKYRRY